MGDHLLAHHCKLGLRGKPEWTCPYEGCGYADKKKSNMLVHLLKVNHHKVKHLVCALCPPTVALYSKQDARNHFKVKHGFISKAGD
ncbi:hypothetical protein M427DRAFT_64349 [Gonapodya prolifera JEL478]|uniref:Uncharacterized protein n=1 Tax=Gonapodya prolifera (strain JEL478) TaxID=1344416 RepID=A0A138ZYV7_GONPJ|nr:hypothetical protein M427DRAFT_64349 [Gonapodya prolifera JEL478]|eukprot:KXS09313.1 hypothetical protein M427DRAFT_64349 [Gonapodya prolifera JEL478]